MVIAQEGFSSMNQSRCTITGQFVAVEEDADKAAAREGYLKRHPEVRRPFAVGRDTSHRNDCIASPLWPCKPNAASFRSDRIFGSCSNIQVCAGFLGRLRRLLIHAVARCSCSGVHWRLRPHLQGAPVCCSRTCLRELTRIQISSSRELVHSACNSDCDKCVE